MNTQYRLQEKQKELLQALPPIATRYLYAIQNRTTLRTQIAYLTDIQNFLLYFISDSDLPLKELAPEQLSVCNSDFFDDYLNYLRHYEKNGKVYTNDLASIKRKLSSIRNFFSFLYRKGLISENAVEKVENPRLRKKEIVRLDKEEASLFLQTVEQGTLASSHQMVYHKKAKVRDVALCSLLLSTGIRVSECVGINLSDVDLDNCSLRVLRKGAKQDIVYFSDACANDLSQYLEQRKQIVPLTGHEEALFLSAQKKRMTPRTIEVLVKKYARQATPLKTITPHKLRATFGTQLYEASGDIYLVASALGHNSVDTSSKYYVNESEKRKQKSRNFLQYREDKE